jgi:hypothetical protein
MSLDLLKGLGVKIPYKAKYDNFIGGKWVGEIVEPLFKKHNIRINYSKRGFYKKGYKKRRKLFVVRLIERLRSLF